MKIHDESMREHVRLAAPYLGIIAVVWLLRLLAYAAGAPLEAARLISVSIGAQVCIVLAVVQMHLRRFGSYANVVVISLLFNAWAQALIVSALLCTRLTGLATIYSHPSFAIPPGHPATWTHIYGQLTFVLAFGTLFTSATGCLLLLLLRLLLPNRES